MADPLAQTFMVDSKNYPNGCFLKAIKLFFKTKSTQADGAVTLSVVGTLNGYPTGASLNHSTVKIPSAKIKTSDTPHYLDSTTYTEFPFSAPVYILPDVLYAFVVKTNTKDCEIWGASLGDEAKPSSVKNLPTDNTPSNVTKISSAPYVGSLFMSQNALTWTADNNSSLMFTIDRCVFNTASNPSIRFVVPKKLPQTTLLLDEVQHFSNANSVNYIFGGFSNQKMVVDAFNVSTTDFVPSYSYINYSYSSTLYDGTTTAQVNITPGKNGTPMPNDILLSDGKGIRALDPNTHTSFSLYATLSSTDDAVSPIISDSGLTLFAIKNAINDCGLSNNIITLVSGGTNYNATTTSVTVSAPDGLNGTQATMAANVVGGVIQSVYFTNIGSGYITTPTVTITDANTTPGSGATVSILGETSNHGGNATARYITRKISLDPSYESGDLNVYLTAYRPVGTDIHVYYKIQNSNDPNPFEDNNWQLMTPIKNSSTLYSPAIDTLYEYAYAPGSNGVDQGYTTYTSLDNVKYTTFSHFAIKIVLRTSDTTNVPFLKDFRAIALPSNVNTTV